MYHYGITMRVGNDILLEVRVKYDLRKIMKVYIVHKTFMLNVLHQSLVYSLIIKSSSPSIFIIKS